MASYFLKQKQRTAVETIVKKWNERGVSLSFEVIKACLSNLDPSPYVLIAVDLLDLIGVINNGIIENYFLNSK